jgi:AMP deaminase
MFPGIVSKNARRSSVRRSEVEDGMFVGFRKGVEGDEEGKERDVEEEVGEE